MSWYKSNINTYRFYKIKYIIVGFLMMLLFLYIFVNIIKSLLSFLSQESVQHSILKLNDYNSLIITILTFFLFLVTAFYAWVTLKMFHEQSEQKKLELRPNIFLVASDPKFIIDESRNLRTVLFEFNLSNFGKGTAINMNLNFYTPDDFNTKTNKFEYVSSSYNNLNPFLKSGENIKGEKSIFTSIYKLNEVTDEFLIISTSFEDIQRNLYELKQYYKLRLFDFHKNSKGYISLSKELLFITLFKHRNSNLYDSEEKQRLLWKKSDYD